jgi:hypothetical protein
VTEPKAIKSSHAMIFVGGDLGDLPTIVHQIGTNTLPMGTHQDILVPNSQADTPTASTRASGSCDARTRIWHPGRRGGDQTTETVSGQF